MTSSEAELVARAEALHRSCVVFDSTMPLLATHTEEALDACEAGGVAGIGATVAGPSLTPESALREMAAMQRRLRVHADRVRLVEHVEDFATAKQEGRLGVSLHFQNSEQFGHDLDSVELWYRMGVRVSQLAYNVRNLAGDGCVESGNAGLSRYGIRLVKEMNRVGMVVDGSHTGERTTLDAMHFTQAPFVFSHTGCSALYGHPRNITDEQIRRCAETGGVVGIFGMPFFLSDSPHPSLSDVVRHVVHAVELVGAEHVGLGLDYANWTHPYTTPSAWAAMVERNLEAGLWRRTDVPLGSWSYAPGIETPAGLPALTAALLAHGFSEEEMRLLLGGSFLRVFGEVWRPREAGRGALTREPARV